MNREDTPYELTEGGSLTMAFKATVPPVCFCPKGEVCDVRVTVTTPYTNEQKYCPMMAGGDPQGSPKVVFQFPVGDDAYDQACSFAIFGGTWYKEVKARLDATNDDTMSGDQTVDVSIKMKVTELINNKVKTEEPIKNLKVSRDSLIFFNNPQYILPSTSYICPLYTSPYYLVIHK